jgi:hypothetical protein
MMGVKNQNRCQRNWVPSYLLDLSDSCQGRVMVSSERGNRHLDLIKSGEILYQLSRRTNGNHFWETWPTFVSERNEIRGALDSNQILRILH